ncbi:NAD-dependent succinate-semialdehyde dehydrogenase [Sphingomicrobium astaxanthinifaciens]|uniref:NAD-dependent succinate-semialdehyde dehydrogenase n=1 Tax=Sphingomicrobium astaxanthinifaciens TaxID=1227949 RepID=UPI001FCC92A0|nr:NAD-dependent succinate-semialdehyde dehydrogenase [Sphingomicrobium astaxanthinifaciens]MCJ7421252.1 NAD-dependent succinate-semialdehyde dehydrogenase [Sphingomicrobium astaxanthinifaciens]
MLKSVNPATGETIATHAPLDEAGIEAALDRAETAFADWRRSSPDERAQLLDAIADRFEAERDALAEIATREMGKTLRESRGEVDKCVTALRYFAQAGPGMIAPEPIPGGKGEMRWLPLGPVLAVMPWNFPFWQVVRFLTPMVMAGNAGLLKHASNVQGVGKAIERVVAEAGAPEGLFQNLVIGSDPVAGIIEDPRVRAATLTGSEPAGRAVAATAGRCLKKVVLELGGSDPFIVMPSADLDKAVETAVRARIQNAGQSCICGKRMIVHRDIHAAFAERFTDAMLAVVAGDPFDEASDMGPMSSADQRQTVLDQLAKAQAAGARLAGGAPGEGPGAYLGAGVLTGLEPDGAMREEELFGPIAMLFEAADVDDAIRIANITPYGLGSAVFTREPAEAERFVTGLDCGMTAINQLCASTPEAPFGGVKNSGHGRELARFGLHEFMNLKSVLRNA